MPAVSIVLATHDDARWLDGAIASVRRQTLADWELLVADDGSSDGTRSVVARHADDGRVRYLPGPHLERAAARNRGLAAAQSELIAFLDADDRWQPAKLERQVAALAAAPEAALCYTIARFVDADDTALELRKPPRAIEGELFPALMRGNFIILASVVARRRCLVEAGGFDETLPVTAARTGTCGSASPAAIRSPWWTRSSRSTAGTAATPAPTPCCAAAWP